MTQMSSEGSEILSDVQGAVITFSDPAYLWSDAILWDRADGSVHAVCHEAVHLIGRITGDMAAYFARFRTAQHFMMGQAYKLRVPP